MNTPRFGGDTRAAQTRVPPKPLPDDEVAGLRAEKTLLNRHNRRQYNQHQACKGLIEGKLVCETASGRCPDYDLCRTEPAEETKSAG